MGRDADLDPAVYVSVALFPVVAVVTGVRLYLRWKRNLLWWDDGFVSIATAFIPCYVAGATMFSRTLDLDMMKKATYYLISPGYYIPVWFARLSVLATVTRMTPPQFVMEHILLRCIAVFLILECICLICFTYVICEFVDNRWGQPHHGSCFQGELMFLLRLIAALISDMMLVAAPLWILRRLLLDPSIRFRIIATFSVSLFTTLFAALHAVSIATTLFAFQLITGIVESSVACMASNALVLIPILFHRPQHSEIFLGGASNPAFRPAISVAASSIVVADMASTVVDVGHLDRSFTEEDKDNHDMDGDSLVESKEVKNWTLLSQTR